MSTETCDDCRQPYTGPAYYTFEKCTTDNEGNPHQDCTFNICPTCCGPFMEPDVLDDKRRPPVDFYDSTLHDNMEVSR